MFQNGFDSRAKERKMDGIKERYIDKYIDRKNIFYPFQE